MNSRFPPPPFLYRFLPFSKAHQNKEYEALLHTHSPYQQKAYGTKYFREKNTARLQGKKVISSTDTPNMHSSTVHIVYRGGGGQKTPNLQVVSQICQI